MRIRRMLETSEPCFSYEFFPPKTEAGLRKLYGRIEHLSELNPSFVSVTYGAGGGSRQRTVAMAQHIKKEIGIEVLAHLTCVGHTRAELEELLDELVDVGVENILALRGDRHDEVPEGELLYARELVALARKRHPHLCIGAACYPETHLESPSPEHDLRWTKEKVDAGVDFLITQLFFQNSSYSKFAMQANALGIDVPIVPGLMPITNVKQIERFARMCGARTPAVLFDRLRKWEHDEQAVMALGMEWAIQQGRELLSFGVPGLHFYTLNSSLATRVVHASLGGRGRWSA